MVEVAEKATINKSLSLDIPSLDTQQYSMQAIHEHEELEQEEEEVQASTDTATENGETSRHAVTGVLYGRSVRSNYACLHLYCPPETESVRRNNPVVLNPDENGNDDDDDDESLSEGETILLRIQFVCRECDVNNNHNKNNGQLVQPVQLRSHIRRFCKPGDLLRIQLPTSSSAAWRRVGDQIDTQWQDLRLVIDLESVAQAEATLQVQHRRYWTVQQLQACQRQFCGQAYKLHGREPDHGSPHCASPLLATPSTNTNQEKDKKSQINNNSERIASMHHGGLLKRTQGEYVKNFLSWMILHYKLNQRSSHNHDDNDERYATIDVTQWAVTDVPENEMVRVRNYLNQGTGVLDVAGGSGHVSMALGLQGIQSTIVDPRDKVGKLPGRDRKVWNRAWNRQQQETTNDGGGAEHLKGLYCQPVQYNVYRAWFGTPPEVRHDDQTNLPVCGGKESDEGQHILANCRAIVALHPDEATDAIVDTAVRRRVPFLIVPCCVFYRLFSHRRMPNNPSQPVSTHEDLLDYLQAKDDSIQRTLLPFEGANTILWSVF